MRGQPQAFVHHIVVGIRKMNISGKKCSPTVFYVRHCYCVIPGVLKGGRNVYIEKRGNK